MGGLRGRRAAPGPVLVYTRLREGAGGVAWGCVGLRLWLRLRRRRHGVCLGDSRAGRQPRPVRPDMLAPLDLLLAAEKSDLHVSYAAGPGSLDAVGGCRG